MAYTHVDTYTRMHARACMLSIYLQSRLDGLSVYLGHHLPHYAVTSFKFLSYIYNIYIYIRKLLQ